MCTCVRVCARARANVCFYLFSSIAVVCGHSSCCINDFTEVVCDRIKMQSAPPSRSATMQRGAHVHHVQVPAN